MTTEDETKIETLQFSQDAMVENKQLVMISDDIVLVPYLPRHVARYSRTFTSGAGNTCNPNNIIYSFL